MAQGADYRVDLSIYNGPLDLLLYLIREREVDIHDIPIAEITEQFLAHLEVVKRVDIDRVGDFLLVAATLMLIKSRMLLPRAEEGEELEEELDPRTDLVRQLLEYKQFKDMSRGLARSEQERDRRFGSGLVPPPPDTPDAGKLLEDVGVDDLLLAFERMMRETLADVDHEIRGEDLPMRELSGQIERELELEGGARRFRDFFLGRRDRYYIVSVFLCLLEMLRAGRIQVEAGGDIVDLVIRLQPVADAAGDRLP
jgi:segregation and condensation protein A